MKEILRNKLENFIEKRLEENGHTLANWHWEIKSEGLDDYFVLVILEDVNYSEWLLVTVYKDARKAVFLDPEYN